MESLDKEPGVDFATSVYHRDSHVGDMIVPTRLMLVQFRSHIRMQQIGALNAEHKVQMVGPLCNIANGFLLLAPAGTGQGARWNSLMLTSDRARLCSPTRTS